MNITEGKLELDEKDYTRIEEQVKNGKKLIKVMKSELEKNGYQLFQVQTMVITTAPEYHKLSTKISKVLRKESSKNLGQHLKNFR